MTKRRNSVFCMLKNQNGNRKNGTYMIMKIIMILKIVYHLSTYINKQKAFREYKNSDFFLSPTLWKKISPTLWKKIILAALGETLRSTSVFLTGYLPIKKLLTLNLIL